MTYEPVSTTRILTVFAVTSAVLVAAVAAALLLSGVGGRPATAQVDTVDLLVDAEELPDVPFVRARSLDSRRNSFPDHFGAESYVNRRWGARHDHYVLVQSVLKYPSTASARAEFEAAPYGRVFDDPVLRDAARPVDLSAENLTADSAFMGCMQNYPQFTPHCYGWAYRARYGNYVVEVTFSSDRDPRCPPGLRQQTFLAIVKAADRHIARLNVN